VTPIAVHRGVVRKEFPVLLAVTGLAWVLIADRTLSSVNAITLLVVLVLLIWWSLYVAMRNPQDELGIEVEIEVESAARALSKRAAWLWVGAGLVLLVLSSRLLVWGAVGIAERLGWPDLVIGLTVVAIGTSAPELAAALAAARKGEGDLGNIIGSNLFNTLGVVGLAGVIAPSAVSPEILSRDVPVVAAFTVAVVIFALGRKGRRDGQGRINRWEGGALLAAFVAYTAYLLLTGV
jgi:cation:H+ antiporter